MRGESLCPNVLRSNVVVSHSTQLGSLVFKRRRTNQLESFPRRLSRLSTTYSVHFVSGRSALCPSSDAVILILLVCSHKGPTLAIRMHTSNLLVVERPYLNTKGCAGSTYQLETLKIIPREKSVRDPLRAQ